MKKVKKIMLMSACTLAILALAACEKAQKQSNGSQENQTVSQTSSEKYPWKATYSNLNSQKSVEEVKSLLAANLDKDSVDNFVHLVNDYNGLVGSTGLRGDFTKFTKTEYDVEKINPLWQAKKGDFIGTNCRINTYTLLKNSIEIPQIAKDDELLFIDNDSIDKGKLFDAKDKEEFNILFSRVKTEATQDVKVHAKKMEEYFKQFKFSEKARMLSVIVHDNLDGDSLFVGHVGVLVPDKDGYLDYTGEGLAKPFIMDNDKWVEGK